MTIIDVILAGLLAFVGWKVLRVLLKIFTPIEFTARAYLLQRFKEMEIDQVVPESLISELIGDSIGSAHMLARSGHSIRAETLKSLDLNADMLSYRVRGSASFNDSETDANFKELFERHKLPRLGR